MKDKEIGIGLEPETVFEKIIQFAKEGDDVSLNQLIDQGYCIHEFVGEYNPIMQLAKDNEVEAVDFLLYRFKASRHHAVEGYALGGHVDRATEQLALGASQEAMMKGYARGGHEPYAKALLESVKDDTDKELELYHAMLEGYAYSGRIELVNKSLRTIKDLEKVVRGYGYTDKLKLLSHHDFLRFSLFEDGVYGLAERGLIKQVDQLIAFGAARDQALAGYAAGNFVTQVDKLIEEGADKELALMSYCFHGHTTSVRKWLTDSKSKNMAILVYAMKGYVEEVNNLIALGCSKAVAVEGYIEEKLMLKQDTLRLLALTEDSELRALLAVYALNETCFAAVYTGEKRLKTEIKKPEFQALLTSPEVKALVAKATKINKMMKEYQLDYRQALMLTTIKGAIAWLLEGQLLVKDALMPLEIFAAISSQVFGLSFVNVEKMRTSLNQHLFFGASKEVDKKYTAQKEGARGQAAELDKIEKSHLEAKVELEEHHHQRITLMA